MLFARRSLTFDLTRRSLIRRRGLLVPMQSETLQLGDFSAIALAYDPGDSESPVRYPVKLQAKEGKELVISTDAQFDESLKKAEFLSSVLRLPLVDTTTDHRTVIAPESVGKALRERLQSTNLDRESPDRPVEMRSQVTMDVGQTTIIVFGTNAVPTVFTTLGPIIALLFVLPTLLRSLARGAPAGLGPTVLTFLILLIGLPALIGWINRSFARKIRKTIVQASTVGIVIEWKHFCRSRATNIPADDIFDVDCRSVETALESTRNVYVNAMPLSQSMPRAQWIFSVLRKLVPSQGIIVKSRQGLVSFGEGLPEIELRYLLWTLRRALAGN